MRGGRRAAPKVMRTLREVNRLAYEDLGAELDARDRTGSQGEPVRDPPCCESDRRRLPHARAIIKYYATSHARSVRSQEANRA